MVLKNKKNYTLKDDILFKAFFSRKGNEEFLIDFLNALLNVEIHKIKIKEEVNIEQLSKEEKGGRLDLQAEINDGTIINIEMQMKNRGNTIERLDTYSAKVKSRNAKRGTDYSEMKKVIMIEILNYTLFPEYEEYVLNTAMVLEKHREYKLPSNTEYYFVELSKFRKQNPDMNNKLNQWLVFLDATDERRMEMAISNNKVLQKAKVEYEYLTGEEAERRLTELREMWEMDRISEMNYAKRKGEERGEKNGKVKIARNMLKANMKIDVISKMTGLTKKEIEKLK